jgi:hypothetical protein
MNVAIILLFLVSLDIVDQQVVLPINEEENNQSMHFLKQD